MFEVLIGSKILYSLLTENHITVLEENTSFGNK